MKLKLLAAAVLAITLSAGADAQGRDDRGDRGERGRDQKSERQDNRVQDRKNYRRNDAEFRNPRYEGRGGGPNHDYYRGGRLPNEYRSRQYVVDDWRGHNLRAPPRGYHWVQSGADYALVAIATGVILDLMLYH